MALLISPIMLALVVIIALELLVMILSITYLLWRGHEGKNSNRNSEFGNYAGTKKISSSVSTVQADDACIIENEVIKVKQDTSSQSSSIQPVDTEEEKQPISSSTSVSSSKDEEEPVEPLESPPPLVQENLQNQEEVEEPESRRSSTSSKISSSSYESSSSSSSDDDVESDENVPSDNELKISDPTLANPVEPTDNPEQRDKNLSTSTSSPMPEELTSQEPANTHPISPTQSFDLGGITLSLRIEHNNFETSPLANGEGIDKPDSDSSFASSESEMEFTAPANDYEDDIQVIRKYEMPVDEQLIYNSGSRQIDGRNFTDDDLSYSDDEEGDKDVNEEDETVAGIINVTSGERLTICQGVKNGLIPRKTALLLLEAQAATGSVVNPRNGVKLSVADAVALGVVDEEYQRTLVAAEGAYYGYMDPRTGENISLCIAMNRNIFPKHQGMRLLEAQMATGGIIDPWTGLRHSLNDAVSKNLLDRKSAEMLNNRVKQTEFFDPSTRNRLGYADLLSKCIRDLDTGMKFLYIEEKPKNIDHHYQPELLTFRSAFRRKVTLQELIDAGLVENATLEAFQSGRITKEELRDILQPFLVGENPIAGVLNKTTNKVRTICQAVQEGILRRGTALELLEAQASTGGIMDPFSGKKMTLNKAINLGLVDSQYRTHLQKAEQAVHGYSEPGTKRTISLFEAMKKGIVIESHGIRMMEAQIATGGVIDPEAGYRIPASVALSKGLFDDRMSQILLSTNHDMKGYFDPNTGDTLTYGELMHRCVRSKKKYGYMLLLPIHDKAPMAAALQLPPQRHREVLASDSSNHKRSISDHDFDASDFCNDEL